MNKPIIKKLSFILFTSIFATLSLTLIFMNTNPFSTKTTDNTLNTHFGLRIQFPGNWKIIRNEVNDIDEYVKIRDAENNLSLFFHLYKNTQSNECEIYLDCGTDPNLISGYIPSNKEVRIVNNGNIELAYFRTGGYKFEMTHNSDYLIPDHIKIGNSYHIFMIQNEVLASSQILLNNAQYIMEISYKIEKEIPADFETIIQEIIQRLDLEDIGGR